MEIIVDDFMENKNQHNEEGIEITEEMMEFKKEEYEEELEE